MSNLVDGCVPAFTKCPYKKDCGDYGRDCCLQKGKKHKVPYSCAIARGFDLHYDNKK